MATRTFGIELETILPAGKSRYDLASYLRANGVDCQAEHYNHRTPSGWKLVSDASVGNGSNSCEIVSPILSGQDGIETARKVASLADAFGCTVNRSCGFHCHVGASDLTVDSLKTLIETYRLNETYIDSLMPVSRRDNNADYARSVLPCGNGQTITQLVDHQFTRYRKLNVASMHRQGTVEFRQHSGTLNADKITAWVEFCLACVEFSARTESTPQTPVTLTGKAAICVQLATRPEGCTADDVRAATGWVKTGGFNHAIRRAGLTLRKERTGRIVRYFATQPAAVTVTTPADHGSLAGLLDAVAVTAETRSFLIARSASLTA